MAFSPDGKTLASGSDDRTVKLWDAATGEARATLKGHTGSVSVRGLQARRQDAGLGQRGQDDQALGRRHRRGPCHPNRHLTARTHGCVFPWRSAPDGKTLASGGDDATIKLWDAVTSEYSCRFPLGS